MIIVVNTRLLLKNKLEGIGWFTYETLSRITVGHPEHQFIFLFDRPFDKEFVFSRNITPLVVFPPTRHPFLWYLWFEWRIPSILKKYKADLFLSPDGYLSINSPVKQLAVIHDLNFFHRPFDLPWLFSKYYNFFFPKYARKASRIATVSEFSKQDLVKSFGIPPEKIDVVHNGYNQQYKPLLPDDKQKVKNRFTGGCDYFLFVGALHPRKNIAGLLTAFEAFKNKSENTVKLVIVGGQMFKTGKIFSTFSQMKHRDDVIFTGRISTDDLALIFGATTALTFVPFFEGFGIPVVEAMAAGVPVICSYTTSLPEVGGDAVLYIDPAQPKQIADAMLRLHRDPEFCKSLVSKGKIQVEKFSWDISSHKLWQAIEKTLEPD